MDYLQTLKTAYQALNKHKVRTALTVLGIVIGIASVIMVVSAGEGVKGYINDQISSFGHDIIQVEVKTPNVSKTSTQNATSLSQGLTITTLTIADAEAVSKLPYVKKINVSLQDQEIINYQGKTKTTIIFGTDENFLDSFGMTIDKGVFIEKGDNDAMANVVVIGPELKDKLFENDDAIGKFVKIRNKNFRVIGITKERGTYFTLDMDSMAFIPVRTLQKQLMGVDYISYFIAKLADQSYIDRGIIDITEILRDRHNFEERNPDKYDFAVNTMQEVAGMVDSIMGGVTLLLLAIAGISLIVGGVGIMNIMYVSVTERTYEIGLRKAVGATKDNILNQFLLEASLITIGGALVGILIGGFFSWVISYVANLLNFNWPFSLPLGGVLLAVVIAIAIGVLFGVYPAIKASKLDPITALRK